MLVGEFVSRYKTLLDRLTEEIHPDPFIQEEINRTKKELSDALDLLANSNSEITEQNLQPLLDFFERREQRVNRSDAISMHNPYHSLNRLCWKIEDELCRVLEKEAYSISIKTLKILRNDPKLNSFNNLNLDPLRPNAFVLSDDGQYAIEVYPCLNEFLESKEFKHTVIVEGRKPLLSESEKNRVINHSQATKELYEKIREEHEWEMKNVEKIKEQRKLSQRQNREAYDKDNLVYKITASYGVKARTDFVKKLFPTLEDVANFLVKHPLNKWEEILNAFDLQDLRVMLLNGIPYETAIANPNLYNQNETHNRAVLVLYSYLLRCEYKSSSEPYLGSTWGWKKEIKDDESDIPHNHLINNIPLADYPKCLSETPHTNALNSQRLGALSNQISVVAKLSNPELNQEAQKSWSWKPW